MSCDLHETGGFAPHDLLGVPRGADRQQVIQAFRRRARLGGHPDTGGDTQTFEDLVRARDILLDPSRRTAYEADPPDGQHQTTRTAPRPRPAPPYSPPPRINGFAVAAVALAVLGPFLWPVALVVGHVALRQIKRTGHGGRTLVSSLLVFLYSFSASALVVAVVSLVAVR